MKRRFGFTLAEVLITLGIIGVVAAMTIPTLMNSTGQAEFKSGFKKAISALNQAVTMNVALADSDFSVLNGASFATDGSIANMFLTRMNVVSTTTAFLSTAGLIDEGKTDNTSPSVSGTTNYTLFLNDGSAIGIKVAAANCILGTAAVTGGSCSAIVDVNGAKKPNRLTNCVSSATTTDAGGTCTKANLVTGDRFSIRLVGNQVQPNGQGARWIMYN